MNVTQCSVIFLRYFNKSKRVVGLAYVQRSAGGRASCEVRSRWRALAGLCNLLQLRMW